MNAEEFKNRFPEFALIDDARINLFLGDAALNINASVWGPIEHLGVAYLAAHLLTLATRGGSGAAGAVTSEKVGDLQRSYGQAGLAGLDALYASTAYGQEYLRLRRSVFVSPFVL